MMAGEDSMIRSISWHLYSVLVFVVTFNGVADDPHIFLGDWGGQFVRTEFLLQGFDQG